MKKGNINNSKSKKGISSLIASTLILGFVLVVSVVIVMWAGGFVEKLQINTEQAEERTYTCAGAVLGIQNVRQTKPNTIEFSSSNEGNRDIEFILIRLSGKEGSTSIDRPGLSLTGKKGFKIEFDPEKVGKVWELNTLPAVKVDGVAYPCAPGTIRKPETQDGIINLWADSCNNGSIDPWEECELGNFNGLNCVDLGYAEGTLVCDSYCTISTAFCTGGTTCGNDIVDGVEECDGLDLNGKACQTEGFKSGKLACKDRCFFDTSECSEGTCGNGIKDGFESCDAADLGGQSCEGLGFVGGSLGCDSLCDFETSGCTF